MAEQSEEATKKEEAKLKGDEFFKKFMAAGQKLLENNTFLKVDDSKVKPTQNDDSESASKVSKRIRPRNLWELVEAGLSSEIDAYIRNCQKITNSYWNEDISEWRSNAIEEMKRKPKEEDKLHSESKDSGEILSGDPKQDFSPDLNGAPPGFKRAVANARLATKALNRKKKKIMSGESYEEMLLLETVTTTTATVPGLVDLVGNKHEVEYLQNQSGSLVHAPSYQWSGFAFKPPKEERIEFPLVERDEVLKEYAVLQTDPTNYHSELFEDLDDYFKRAVALPSENYYTLLVLWVFHTYCMESAAYSPILWFYGGPESGKTRAGLALTQVAFHGKHLDAINPAYVVRAMSLWSTSLFFDINDFERIRSRPEECLTLLSRFERGIVPKVKHSAGSDIDAISYYSTFGPTLLATNSDIGEALRSRAIKIPMQRTSGSSMIQDAAELRTRLLAFRCSTLVHPFSDLGFHMQGRLGDMIKPLFELLVCIQPDRCGKFLAFLRGIESERQKPITRTLDQRILTGLWECRGSVTRGRLPERTLLDLLNKNCPRLECLSATLLGRRLKKLGFEISHGEGGAAVMLWDYPLLKMLLDEHELEVDVTEIPESSAEEAKEEPLEVLPIRIKDFIEELSIQKSKEDESDGK